MLFEQQTINCRGQLLDLSRPLVMGILNLTPDSFFDGGRYTTDSQLLRRVEQMLEEGAAIIDVGGMSSRPGAAIIPPEEELKRVTGPIQQICNRFPEAVLSIDTLSSEVAREAVEAGAKIVNDISAGRHDTGMISTVAALRCPFIAMHMLGQPATMQQSPEYEDVVETVFTFFAERLTHLRKAGILDVILDPGFGFGKTLAHNLELLQNLSVFRILELPLLVGISRKSMVCKLLDVSPKDALNGTTALHMIALRAGARILRVHDVREAMEAVKVHEAMGGG